jgi:prevent-host-death family protein
MDTKSKQQTGAKMENIERKNTAVFRAELPSLAERVRDTKEPIIIQRHNKDICAVVPLEDLKTIAKSKGK